MDFPEDLQELAKERMLIKEQLQQLPKTDVQSITLITPPGIAIAIPRTSKVIKHQLIGRYDKAHQRDQWEKEQDTKRRQTS